MWDEESKKTPYLKNAWAKQDADGDSWLFIQSKDGQALFCLSECLDLYAQENALKRCALDVWLAEQDSACVNMRQSLLPQGWQSKVKCILTTTEDRCARWLTVYVSGTALPMFTYNEAYWKNTPGQIWDILSHSVATHLLEAGQNVLLGII